MFNCFTWQPLQMFATRPRTRPGRERRAEDTQQEGGTNESGQEPNSPGNATGSQWNFTGFLRFLLNFPIRFSLHFHCIPQSTACRSVSRSPCRSLLPCLYLQLIRLAVSVSISRLTSMDSPQRIHSARHGRVVRL